MDIERAIEILNPEHREQYDSIATVKEACRMGMQALEKQIPKKPQDKFSTHAIIDNEEYIDNIDIMTFECPVCNGVLASGEIEKENCIDIHYCENCGQAIDWSEEE